MKINFGSVKEKLSGGKKGKPKKKWLKIVIALVLIAVILISILLWRSAQARQAAAEAETVNTAVVTRQNITSELSSSGTLEAAETYSVTSLVEGEIISANFEEGDQVEKDQVLYEIDHSSMETQLTSATNRLTRAQKDLEDAQEDYQQAQSDYSGNTYKATESGYINTLHIHVGDRVSGNSQLADLYSDDQMKIRIPFLSGEADLIGVGNGATLTLVDTGEQLAGTVTAVANREQALTGGRLVKYVTITVQNPGGLTDVMRATAQIGEFIGSEDGTFTAAVDTTMTADLNSTVEVAELLVNEGDYVTQGTPIFRMTTDSAADLLESYSDAVDQAEESVESAQSSLETTQDSYDNYTIKAPIAGQVIAKNYNVGETITRDSNSENTLAVIYDLSSLTFEMSIDELDVSQVEVGQSVVVTADAFEGETFSGTVTNVSLESTYSNGVTTYPVTVTMNDGLDKLLPGMNVDGVITLAQADDVLTIPVDALMRGNQVYVQDSSVTEAQGPVPAGFKAVQVENGLMNDSYVEITSGLNEGDVVYVAESTQTSSFMMMPGGGMGGGGMGGGPGGGMGGGPGGGGGGPR